MKPRLRSEDICAFKLDIENRRKIPKVGARRDGLGAPEKASVACCNAPDA